MTTILLTKFVEKEEKEEKTQFIQTVILKMEAKLVEM